MVISLPGLPGVSAAELAVEVRKEEQEYVLTLLQANVDNLASVIQKSLPTVTLTLVLVRITSHCTVL